MRRGGPEYLRDAMSDSPFNIKHGYGTCYATWCARRKARELAGKYGFDGEDLAQEFALHLLCQWPLYDPSKAKPTTFIQNVVDTKVTELIRNRCRQRRDFRREQSLSQAANELDHGKLDGVRGQPEVSDQSLVELRSDCDDIFERLTAELREIAELLKENTPEAVAHQLGIPRTTIWRRMDELREHFERAGYSHA